MPRASNGQTRIPLVATLPWVSDHVPCAAYLQRHPCLLANSVSVWASTTRCRFRRILKSRTWSALSSQPCTGKAAHVAGQFSRMRCMRYSLFDGIYYSDNRSNSRANTCNKPRLLEGTHLLDKRSTQALPVALMIHDNSSDRTALVPATHHSNFCPINFRW
ncbi:hypothetical protein VNO80_31983 [Phaseolus coccineus]|uniref:Uncharacterized protein n=1 Tax=Phaseolus coccineus TaxID=3886 RepID=A0AAN9L0I5_PHACN